MEELIRNREAARWGEAFPLGNGHMGAMYYGGISTDRIDLSEHTFYSGAYDSRQNREGADAVFAAMRRELQRGDYEAAHKRAEGFIGRRLDYGTNLPVGTVWLSAKPGRFCKERYQRRLNLGNGVAECLHDDVAKTLWVSHPDKMLVYHWYSEEPADLCIRLELYSGQGQVTYGEEGFSFSARAVEHMHCDRAVGVLLSGYGRIRTDGTPRLLRPKTGREGADVKSLMISGAREVTLYLAMETDFMRDMDGTKLLAMCRGRILAAQHQPLGQLQRRHMEDVAGFMRRCSLELSDPGLAGISFQFQMGRYLLLASSREDSRLPAHLQGIWNDNVACRIGWTCDLHLDINTQMNYWPAEVTGLPETAEPLFRWIRDSLVPKGEESARVNYGRSGWVAELVSNAWGFTAPYWAVPLSPCPTGGLWVMTQLWEHYLSYPKESFLREQVYPVYEKAVEFFAAYVFRTEDGHYSSGPSISPENSFTQDGNTWYLSCGCTYEILMIRELFCQYLQMTGILGIRNSLRDQAARILPELLPYRILADGTIAEWAHDLPAADPQHRHTSHLLGLFPFAQITPEDTPELARAAERTIAQKLTPPENWEDTGWARSMLMLYEARLGHGDQAWSHICGMLSALLEPNGMIIHPPTRGAGSFDNVYELDGNTGLTACIAELLLQSHRERLRLLPARPASWETGCVRGLRARGGIEVSICWEQGQLTEAELVSDRDQEVTVCYHGAQVKTALRGGVGKKLRREDFLPALQGAEDLEGCAEEAEVLERCAEEAEVLERCAEEAEGLERCAEEAEGCGRR